MDLHTTTDLETTMGLETTVNLDTSVNLEATMDLGCLSLHTTPQRPMTKPKLARKSPPLQFVLTVMQLLTLGGWGRDFDLTRYNEALQFYFIFLSVFSYFCHVPLFSQFCYDWSPKVSMRRDL